MASLEEYAVKSVSFFMPSFKTSFVRDNRAESFPHTCTIKTCS